MEGRACSCSTSTTRARSSKRASLKTRALVSEPQRLGAQNGAFEPAMVDGEPVDARLHAIRLCARGLAPYSGIRSLSTEQLALPVIRSAVRRIIPL